MYGQTKTITRNRIYASIAQNNRVNVWQTFCAFLEMSNSIATCFTWEQNKQTNTIM